MGLYNSKYGALLMKTNVPQELVENMGVKEVGYLFQNAEKMDIQAERRNTKEARERAEAAEKRVETAEKELESTKAKLGMMGASLRNMMGKLAGICKTEGLTKEETRNRLHDFYQVDESDLETYFEEVWKAAIV